MNDIIFRIKRKIKYIIRPIKYNIKYSKLKIKQFYFYTNEELIKKIIEEKKSIGRFGDGELLWAFGLKHNSFQNNNSKMQKMLMEILNNNRNDFIVCLPRTLNNVDGLIYKSKSYWKEFAVKNNELIINNINNGIKYGDSLITRPYMDYIEKNFEFIEKDFNLLKKIWDKKDVIIVEGEYSRLGVGNDLFNNCNSIQRILCPSKNAFDYYSSIYDNLKNRDKKMLYLFALGPTATILSYNLSKEGFQCIDIGHVDVEYMWFKSNSKKKSKIAGKFVLEAGGYEELEDNDILEKYNSQIIQRIGI